MFHFTIRDVLWLTVVALAVGLTAAAVVAGPTIRSRAPEQACVTTITQKMLDDSPAWEAKDENPPLSARKAIEAANAVVVKLVEPDTKSWKRRLEGLFLCEGDPQKWYWRVQYLWDPPPGTAMDGQAPHMTIVVLMDGTVVQPSVAP